MRLIFVLNFLTVYFTGIGLAQSYVRVYPEDKDILPLNVVSMYTTGNIGAAPSNKYLGINVEDLKNATKGFLVSNFVDPLHIKSNILFTQADGTLELIKMFGNGDYEIILFGMYQSSVTERFIFCANYSYRLKQLTSFKVIDLPNEPNRILELKDVAFERDQFYLLATTKVDYLSTQRQKIVLINYDGMNAVWSKAYNFTAPIHSESPSNITFDPNGNFAICGTIQSSGENFERMMIAEIKKNGEPGVLKKIELLATNQTFSHRYGWTYIKNRGTNLHLFSQAILGGSDPGQLLVTMFDVNYALRTWRNYTIPIRAEFSMIESNFFYFGGQAPIGKVYDGYTMVKVNASNAIVEGLSYFEKGIDNLDINTSSTACYERANDKIWTAVKSNNSEGILLIENPSSLGHRCGSNLSSSVAKDTIRITDYSLTSKDIEIRASDYTARVQEIVVLAEEICKPTRVEDDTKKSLKIDYYEETGILRMDLGIDAKCIRVFDYMGKCYLSKNLSSNIEIELHCPLAPGIYYFNLISKAEKNYVQRFVVFGH